MQTVKITPPQNIDIDYEIVGLGKRILARLIDYLVVFIVFFLCIAILFFCYTIFDTLLHLNISVEKGIMSVSDDGWMPIFLKVSFIIYVVIFIFYNLVTEIFFNGQSIGKRAVKIKVVSIDGTQPTIRQYLLRWIFSWTDFVTTAGLGAVIAITVSAKKQRIGDSIAGTILVKTTPSAIN